HLRLQPSHLLTHVAESLWPASRIELAQRFAGRIPSLLVNLCGGQPQEAGRLARSQAPHLFPLNDRVGPAILLLADLRQKGVALRFGRLHLDNRRVSSLRFRRLARSGVTLAKLLVEFE